MGTFFTSVLNGRLIEFVRKYNIIGAEQTGIKKTLYNTSYFYFKISKLFVFVHRR